MVFCPIRSVTTDMKAYYVLNVTAVSPQSYPYTFSIKFSYFGIIYSSGIPDTESVLISRSSAPLRNTEKSQAQALVMVCIEMGTSSVLSNLTLNPIGGPGSTTFSLY